MPTLIAGGGELSPHANTTGDTRPRAGKLFSSWHDGMEENAGVDEAKREKMLQTLSSVSDSLTSFKQKEVSLDSVIELQKAVAAFYAKRELTVVVGELQVVPLLWLMICKIHACG